MGNEPCEGTPWIYDFAGAPAHAQQVVRRIQKELFTTQPSGLPGNDDAGALSSWHVFSMLGLYPEIPGVAGLVIGSPAFPKATIHLDNGATIQVIGNGASAENCYVQCLKLNGQGYDKLWLPWSALSQGATLNFSLGAAPSAWEPVQIQRRRRPLTPSKCVKSMRFVFPTSKLKRYRFPTHVNDCLWLTVRTPKHRKYSSSCSNRAKRRRCTSTMTLSKFFTFWRGTGLCE